MTETTMEFLIKHAHEFILKDDLIKVISLMLGIFSLFIGIMNSLFFRSIKGLLAEREIKITENVQKHIADYKKENHEIQRDLIQESQHIKSNYINKFNIMNKKMHKLHILLLEVKADIKVLQETKTITNK